MSGYVGDTLQAHGIGDDTPFLQKPFLPAALVDKVSDLLKTSENPCAGP